MNCENDTSSKELSVFDDDGALFGDGMQRICHPETAQAAAPTTATPSAAPSATPSATPSAAPTPYEKLNRIAREEYREHVDSIQSENSLFVMVCILLTFLLAFAMFRLQSGGINRPIIESRSAAIYYTGFVLLGIIWFVTEKMVNFNRDAQNTRRRRYQEQYPGDDSFAGPDRKRWIGGRVIACCCIIAIIAKPISDYAAETKRQNLIYEQYDRAVSLVDSGAYQEAGALFEEIRSENYRDTKAYIRLCDAHIKQEKGDIDSAFNDVVCSEFKFSYLTAEQIKVMNNYVLELHGEWSEYRRKCEEEKAEEKAEEERKQRVREAVGYPKVGMLESALEYTLLGGQTYQRLRDYAKIDGEQCVVNIYIYTYAGYTVRCANGKIIEVTEHIKEPAAETLSPSSSKSKKSSKSSTKEDDDPYNVNDFYYAEDFYDEHYDDFFDYYDAEDYFNEHHE